MYILTNRLYILLQMVFTSLGSGVKCQDAYALPKNITPLVTIKLSFDKRKTWEQFKPFFFSFILNIKNCFKSVLLVMYIRRVKLIRRIETMIGTGMVIMYCPMYVTRQNVRYYFKRIK